MTPEGRRRKARAALANIDQALALITEARKQIHELCADAGIRPPLVTGIMDIENNTRIAFRLTADLIISLTSAIIAAKENRR